MVNISNTEAALKDYYLDVVKEQLNHHASPFASKIVQTSENVVGKDARVVVVKEGDQKIVALGEESILANNQMNVYNKYYSLSLPLKNIYGAIEISDKAIRASSNSVGAAVSVLNCEMEGLIEAAKDAMARMIFGDPDGYLGKLMGSAGNNWYFTDNPKPCFIGKNFKLKSPNNNPGSMTIDDVDMDAGTIHATQSLNINDFPHGIFYGPNDYGMELSGLKYIFDSPTIYGYDKATEPYFRPVRKEMDRDELKEDDLLDIIDSIQENGGKLDMIVCSHRTRRKIASLMSYSRRTVNTNDVAAGVSSVIINDIPVYAEKYCPENRIYFLNSSDFVLHQLCDWSWIEDDRGGILMPGSKRASYSATLVKYAELICKRPCGQGLILLNRQFEEVTG